MAFGAQFPDKSGFPSGVRGVGPSGGQVGFAAVGFGAWGAGAVEGPADWAETRPDAMQAAANILAIIGFRSLVFRHMD